MNMWCALAKRRSRYCRLTVYSSTTIVFLVLYAAKDVIDQPEESRNGNAPVVVDDDGTDPIPSDLKRRVIRWPGERFAEPDNGRIFFHETSGRDVIQLRQSCSIESAAKHNPNRTVQLFMHTRRLNSSSPFLLALSQYPNIQIILLNEREYFKETPFEDWYVRGQWKKSPHKWAHMADFVRMITLRRGGGLFLDLDVVTRKSYAEDIFVNFFSVESVEVQAVSNAMVHLEKDHRLIDYIVKLMAFRSKTYDPQSYMLYGPDVFCAVMNAKCGFSPGRTRHWCKDVHLLTPDFFYPIGNPFLGKMFEKADNETIAKISRSYGVHISNALTRNSPIDLHDPDQTFTILAQQNCPFTVAQHLNSVK